MSTCLVSEAFIVFCTLLSDFFLALITAGLAPIPKNPLLPFDTTSYSTLSLVVSSLTKALVSASSTVFPLTSI